MRRTLSILGSTGSIGTQSLAVLSAHHPDIDLEYLTTNSNVELLAAQVQQHQVRGVVIGDEQAVPRFRALSNFKGEILVGREGLLEAASTKANDLVISALVGFTGVEPTVAAVRQGKTVALANKESLVSAGELITQAASQHGAQLIAVDSEHSAILQCLVGEDPKSIESLTITASGGPFREATADEIENASVEQALRHPNWTMGSKITIDSATLMNKGLEVIEARWLFDIAPSRIDVVVHPQSIIHSMVTFVDGSVKAQLGLPTMVLPIHYALNYPERTPTTFARLDLRTIKTLSFFAPDTEKFPCLPLAFQALERGGTATAILNAANEVAVGRFLSRSIRFGDIARVVSASLNAMPVLDHPSLAQIIDADAETRRFAEAYVPQTIATHTQA